MKSFQDQWMTYKAISDERQTLVNEFLDVTEEAMKVQLFEVFPGVNMHHIPASLLPLDHPEYVKPTPEEVGFVLDVLENDGYSKNAIGRMFGFPATGNEGRLFASATKGKRELPNAVWRLLLVYAGLAVEFNRTTSKLQGRADKISDLYSRNLTVK